MSNKYEQSAGVRYGKAQIMGDSFGVTPTNDPNATHYAPYVHAGLMNHPKPRNAEEMAIRANFKHDEKLEQYFGELPKMDPQRWAEFTEDIEAQKEEYIRTAISSAAVEWETQHGRRKFQSLAPHILQRHLKAIETYKIICAQIWKMMQKRSAKTSEDIDFLMMLANPMFVVPEFPAIDPFGLYFATQKEYVDAAKLYHSNRGSRLDLMQFNSLYHKGDGQTAFSKKTKVLFAHRIFPMSADGTMLRIAKTLGLASTDVWLEKIQYQDPLDTKFTHKKGKKLRQAGQPVEDSFLAATRE